MGMNMAPPGGMLTPHGIQMPTPQPQAAVPPVAQAMPQTNPGQYLMGDANRQPMQPQGFQAPQNWAGARQPMASALPQRMAGGMRGGLMGSVGPR
jgi:hypothetical protein